MFVKKKYQYLYITETFHLQHFKPFIHYFKKKQQTKLKMTQKEMTGQKRKRTQTSIKFLQSC